MVMCIECPGAGRGLSGGRYGSVPLCLADYEGVGEEHYGYEFDGTLQTFKILAGISPINVSVIKCSHVLKIPVNLACNWITSRGNIDWYYIKKFNPNFLRCKKKEKPSCQNEARKKGAEEKSKRSDRCGVGNRPEIWSRIFWGDTRH